MVRLSVWYVRLLLERGEIARGEVGKALCERVNLYRLTDFWDGARDGDNGEGNPEWMALVGQMAGWVCETPMGETARLEEQVVDLLGPALESRIPKDVGPPPERPFAC